MMLIMDLNKIRFSFLFVVLFIYHVTKLLEMIKSDAVTERVTN